MIKYWKVVGLLFLLAISLHQHQIGDQSALLLQDTGSIVPLKQHTLLGLAHFHSHSAIEESSRKKDDSFSLSYLSGQQSFTSAILTTNAIGGLGRTRFLDRIILYRQLLC